MEEENSEDMVIQLQDLQREAEAQLNGIHTGDALEEWRQLYLSKKSRFSQLLRGVGLLPPATRPLAGNAANRVKTVLESGYEVCLKRVQEEQLERDLLSQAVDITLPGYPAGAGRLHIITQTIRDICRVFTGMGFQIYESPELETDEYNFGLLNIPPYHPARDMWDTFWVDDELLLRTHTSPGQVRAMREFYPEPIRVILPGKCYRYEQVTARSEHQFYQIEGLAVGKNITMADLIGTLTGFARQYYREDVRFRIRSSYFPFTEPSIEMDMSCILCNGAGCRVCKQTGWLEIGGAGMVHPAVLKNGGYDPDEWSGFAFGPGVERPAMIKHGIRDIRYFYGNDLRFLRQF
jgi:phenylalanyl-tRNA synthetase alpha chain